MSIFSDYKVGALTDFEFEQECRRMNREEREYEEQDYEWENGEKDYDQSRTE